MAAKQSYFHGTGRRKTSVAQVKIMPGNGAIIINGVPYEELFPSLEHRRAILQPLLVTESLSKFNAMIKVNGGGITGQSGAISLGIARALVESNESLKSILRQYGLLTRDPRVKERKKPGLRRARKAPQYTKR
ncbi:MAG: 30S ribosomal protein S9 [Dehalococcoidia bacterium]|jgi:small subunit ribosomal protein S9|nr:MAG: 30S ribosomal protein S9 [Dehalococcoidia bacterium]